MHFYIITFLIDAFLPVCSNDTPTLMDYSYSTLPRTAQKTSSTPPACCNVSPRKLIDVLDDITLYDKYDAPTHAIG
jgi:hypothetical protein